MVTKFEELVHGMVNIGFGAAALTAEKGKEVLDTLNAKGEQVRSDAAAPDFARSMSDIFEQAGGTFSDVTERLGAKGESAHVRDLVDSVDDATVTVKVEVESADVEADETNQAEGQDE